MSDSASGAVLAIDAGNSRVKFQFFEKGHNHAPVPFIREVFERGGRDALEAFIGSGPPLGMVVIACARLTDEEPLRALLEPHCAAIHFLHLADPMPVNFSYSVGRPGPDRVAAAIGLHDFYPGEPAISIDFGTATNTVVINEDGDFLGGAILPGLRLQTEMLESATRGRLPHTNLAEPLPEAFPDSTAAAIRLGVVLGHAGAVERLLAHHRRVMGDETIPCLVTGGNADYIAPHLGFDFQRSENLVLHGLACWAHSLPREGVRS